METNAAQYNLTGCAIMTPHHNIVVVEGGPKNMRKYKRLMLQRIKWDEKGESASASLYSCCQLLSAVVSCSKPPVRAVGRP